MAISLTDSAAERVLTYLEKRGGGVGLRLGITETGCSGYSYVINYADEIDDVDVVFEDKGVTVVVHPDCGPPGRTQANRWYRGRFCQKRTE